ncbi:hypothetical protein [Flavobacterium taihuense]|uniref:MG2 domain-containing protein n=1 Tax=Flavobacterium taihuense TaxID=2857508 RepID=A0ABS6XSU3_9FLAO|nr:hypothetical protein [Flavobacterium taihuense]MBW4359742.1 hypothetical protein [Flavobacterium taihuense]
MIRIKQILSLFALISTQLISAQKTVVVDESIYLHANASTFVSGETLLYKVYCLKSSDKTPSVLSKIAYVELVDSNKKPVLKTKIVLENSCGQGEYFIPTTLKTGKYKLIGYTSWILNKATSDLFQMDITIINPFKADEKNASDNILKTNQGNSNLAVSTNEIISKDNNISSENLKFNLNKKTFTNRELVDLKIESLNPLFKDGTYSLSVRKIDSLPSKKAVNPIDFLLTNQKTIIDLENQKNNIVLPELRGENISGKIIAKDPNRKVENIAIAFSLPGKSFAFKIVMTDPNGAFNFTINKANYNTNIIVQIIDDHADYYTLSLDNPHQIDYSKLIFPANENLSYFYKESLLNRSISTQIENAYFYKKTDNLINPVDVDPFYSSFEKEYILDDYTRFKTLKETITEVATEIYLKQLNNNYYLHVMDPNVFPQLPEPALVLIDGLLLQNQNDLINYNMKNIFKIDLIAGRYYVGATSFNGLICLTTFNKDFKSNQSESSMMKAAILRPQPKKVYYKIDYSDLSKNERIPDYRYQLLWLPQLTLASNENPISFYTSDLTGTFEISLEGFTDQGIPVSLKDTFEVQ